MDCFHKANDLRPQERLFMYSIGLCLQKMDKHQEAIDQFEECLKLNPDDKKAKKSKLHSQQLIQKQRGAHKSPDTGDSAALVSTGRVTSGEENELYAQLESLLKEDKFKDAIHVVGKLLEMRPNEVSLLEYAGLCLKMLGFHKEAAEQYDKALEIQPENAKIWGCKGECLGNIGEYHREINCYDKALHIDPTDYSILFSKGVALALVDKTKEALECFDKALLIKPDFEACLQAREKCAVKVKKSFWFWN
uniref:Uncharacterized protein n=1 Tax=Arcella intermedia TaxID=1963864 RepID=A0A6B2LEC6_9EUKA